MVVKYQTWQLEAEEIIPMLTKTIALIIAIRLYFLLRREPRVKYHLDKLPGPRVLPVIGNALQLCRPHNELLPIFHGWFKEHGKSYRLWIGNVVPYFFTSDANVIEELMSGTKYLNKGKHDYSLIEVWLGTGLLTAPGRKWAPRRKLLTPSFHFKMLEGFTQIFNEQATVFLECLERDGHTNGKTFDMQPYIITCTLDIICESAMGKQMNTQTSSVNKEYFDAVNGICESIIDKGLKPWLRSPLVCKLLSISARDEYFLGVLKGFSEQVIQTRKLERKLNREKGVTDKSLLETPDFQNEGVYGKNRPAFLDLLLDLADVDGQLSDDDIREEVDTFMFEGHDTTAMNVSWSVLLFAIHPKCQELVQKEIDEIFANDPTRHVSATDISNLKYLDCFVKESLRLFPSVPFITRQIDTDFPLGDGKIVPKGATAMIHIYAMHRDPEYFPEPEKFLPERWQSEEKRHPFSYIPFSGGSRNCIGQKFALLEEKIILIKLLRTYKIETKETMESLKTLPHLVLRSENGVHVRLRKREINGAQRPTE